MYLVIFQHHTFWWEGIDGSILLYFSTIHSGGRALTGVSCYISAPYILVGGIDESILLYFSTIHSGGRALTGVSCYISAPYEG